MFGLPLRTAGDHSQQRVELAVDHDEPELVNFELSIPLQDFETGCDRVPAVCSHVLLLCSDACRASMAHGNIADGASMGRAFNRATSPCKQLR